MHKDTGHCPLVYTNLFNHALIDPATDLKDQLGTPVLYASLLIIVTCPKIDSYDFAKEPLGTKAGVVQADPLITYKGDRDALLIQTTGADTLHNMDKAYSLTNWREI